MRVSHRGSVQVSERGGRRRVGKVISGHVHGLHGGDGPLVRRRNTLLQNTDAA